MANFEVFHRNKKLSANLFFLKSDIGINFNKFQYIFDFFSDSEKFHEMAAATESPPKQCFLLDDDGEFPPMSKAK